MLFNRPLVSAEMGEWIFDNYDWALHHHLPDFWRNPNSLVRLTKAYFPTKNGTDSHAIAQGLFSDTKQLLGLEHLNIKLEPLPQIPAEIAHEYGKTSETSGEYWHDDIEPLITYAPDILAYPTNFIATMAHELMHAKLAPHIDALPGGAAAHELTTDLHCIIHGFGLIQIKGAVDVGWSGYLSQDTRIFATAIFLQLTDNVDQFSGLLPRRYDRQIRKALKQLGDWQPEMNTLQAAASQP